MKSKRHKVYDVLIVGGGFYGCALALYLKKSANSVILVEKEKDLLLKASYNNQARVHNGYHYPRSYLTALRSHMNYAKFSKDFKGAIYKDFRQYYAMARNFSKTTTNQFIKFCYQLGSPVRRAPESFKRQFNERLIEDVVEVDECVFDAGILRKILKEKLKKDGIVIKCKTEIYKVSKSNEGITCLAKGRKSFLAKNVFNCTYSNINRILLNSKLRPLPLKHEFIEMPLIKLPESLSDVAVTVLDGPFFGFLPFPDRKVHSLWHVRYAVHTNWIDPVNKNVKSVLDKFSKKSNYQFMIKDATRYIPAFSDAKYMESIYETKTVLIDRETSDARPILFRKDYGIPGLHIVLGSKMDNIYDIIYELRK